MTLFPCAARRSRRIFPAALLCLLACLLSACGKSAPTYYYLLESGEKPFSSPALPSTSLRIAHVGIPGSLDRQGVVSRSEGDPLLNVNNFDIWAEPLDQGIRRVLREVLSPPLLAGDIAVQTTDDAGWKAALLVDVLRLDGAPGEPVRPEPRGSPLDTAPSAMAPARWSLLDSADRVMARGSFADSAPCPAALPGTAATSSLVRTQSLLVQRLGKALAPEIVRALNGRRQSGS